MTTSGTCTIQHIHRLCSLLLYAWEFEASEKIKKKKVDLIMSYTLYFAITLNIKGNQCIYEYFVCQASRLFFQPFTTIIFIIAWRFSYQSKRYRAIIQKRYGLDI